MILDSGTFTPLPPNSCLVSGRRLRSTRRQGHQATITNYGAGYRIKAARLGHERVGGEQLNDLTALDVAVLLDLHKTGVTNLDVPSISLYCIFKRRGAPTATLNRRWLH